MKNCVCLRWLAFLLLGLADAGASVAAEPAFRVDGGDEKLPWFQLQPGEFPPEGSAHAIAGELISVDHVNRKGVLRMDRADNQRNDDYDKPLPFTLLPYGSVRFHGAPAELRDIPLGTHLHGQFYADGAGAKPDFSHALGLQDDFSFFAGKGRSWRVDHVDRDKGTLALTGVGPSAGDADPKPTMFRISPATRVWKGRAIGALADLAEGQTILVNLTVCTLKGPGRCLDVWLDAESRAAATALQLETHRQFAHEHGLAARVDEVDNPRGIVTVTVFSGFDPSLMENFLVDKSIAAAVAEDSLRTHDQVNDVSRGPIVEKEQASAAPGGSGWRIRFKPSVLLEGYRPKRIVRIFAGGWPVDDLPREEKAYDG